MRVLFANDKYAGTMSAWAAAQAMAAGWQIARPFDEVRCVPMADGGPGTVAVVHGSSGGTLHTTPTINQRGDPIQATWLELPGSRALLESRSACGLDLIPVWERDPVTHNSRGLGRLLRSIVDCGIGEIMIGMGGTGTVDGGLGAVMELGVDVFDRKGEAIRPLGPKDYDKIVNVSDRLRLQSRLMALVDVRNPLLGSNGAVHTFAPQKGASEEETRLLESRLGHLADVTERALAGGPWRHRPGAGAAGGLGFALMAWAGASVVSGAEQVADMVNLADHVRWSDIVITGEGRIDHQTKEGKAPSFVSLVARTGGKLVLAIAGSADPDELTSFDDVELLGPEGKSRPLQCAQAAATRLAGRRQF